MERDDLFVDTEPDPWFEGKSIPVEPPRLNLDLLRELRSAPLTGISDVEVGVALIDLASEEFRLYGTGGGEVLSDSEVELLLRALRATLKRLSIEVKIPFRNFTTFRNYWNANDGYGSYQARRDIVGGIFEGPRGSLIALEDESLEGLAIAISPHRETGWPRVDEEVRELRRKFQVARTPQDHRALGTNIVGVLEALSEVVYNPELHLRQGEAEPPVDQSKNRIERYIETALPGKPNEDIRRLARTVISLAHHLKHSPAPTRRNVGIASDAAILLANMLRRLQES